MSRFPKWYRAAVTGFMALWVAIGIYYWMGASGVRIGGMTASFERQGDSALLRIDGTRAFRVDRGELSVTRYRRAPFPFCPLCGVHEQAGTIMNLAGYRKGDWVYTSFPQPFVEAVNLATGETIDLPAGGGALTQPPPAFVARGLDFAPANAIDPDLIRASFPLLSTIHESCVVFNLGFLSVFAALTLLGVVLVASRRRRPS